MLLRHAVSTSIKLYTLPYQIAEQYGDAILLEHFEYKMVRAVSVVFNIDLWWLTHLGVNSDRTRGLVTWLQHWDKLLFINKQLNS